jgi:hypothetical protein
MTKRDYFDYLLVATTIFMLGIVVGKYLLK